MERFDTFLDTILEGERDKEQLKPLFMEQMVRDYKYYRKKGYADQEAVDQTLYYFGTKEAVLQRRADFELQDEHSHFLELYPKLIKGGLACIGIIPLVFLCLIFTLEAKLYFLVLWIVSIIAIAVFLILVEYRHYQYKDLLEKREDQRH